MPVSPLPAVIQAEERQCTKILQNTHRTLEGTSVGQKLIHAFKTWKTQNEFHDCSFQRTCNLLLLCVNNRPPFILFDRIL